MPLPGIRTREQTEEAERLHLAPWAQFSAESAGRRHPEPAHPFRAAYQRDRARVVHSRAFRRLEYKTQVFLNGTGDHLRTRLTHTIEVASISRTIACALGANEDLAETIALAHDLGHSPFGHAGEKRLDQLMREAGGFEHNLQSLRIVEKLERKYPNFEGLNLSYEVLEGLRKHEEGFTRWASGDRAEEVFPHPSLEAQIANCADEITYYSHDLDDGLDHALISPDQLEDLETWQNCARVIRKQFPDLSGKRYLTYVIRSLIDFQVADVIRETHRRLTEHELTSADAVRRFPGAVVGYSEPVRKANIQLRKFLFQNLYFHPTVSGPNERGCEMIEGVFQACLEDPRRMGSYAESHPEDDPKRTICDYISGMTDRFIRQEYERLRGG